MTARQGQHEPTFRADILPNFRELDRNEMAVYFDLWSYAEVKANAERILERLTAGDMPCDAPWAAEQVELFRAWRQAGCPE
jgi:hypothetical protein